jgi:hypothetical protein
VKITEKTTLSRLLGNSKIEKILAKHNLPCLSCPMAQHEMEDLKIGQICEMYNIDVEKLIKEINKVCNK